ncbi:MAG: prolyl oligopeptidase family serine peptidase [Kofleriaceae bacterium]
MRQTLLLLPILAAACGSTPAAPQQPASPPAVVDAAPPADLPPLAVGHPSQDLIPRALLFGNPARSGVQLSPDGAHLSYLAAKDGVMNIYVAPVGDLAAARAITSDTKRPVRMYFWAFTNQHVVYLQDAGGDENFHAIAVEVATGKTTDLTPYPGVRAQITGLSHRKPTTILIGMNDRDPSYHDVYAVDLTTGVRTLVHENQEGFSGWVVDDDLNLRLAISHTETGGVDYLTKLKGAWTPVLSVPAEDAETTSVLGFNAKADAYYLSDSRGRDTAALYTVPFKNGKSGKPKLVLEDPRVDVADILTHPTKNTIEAVSLEYDRARWQVLDKAVAGDFAAIDAAIDGDFVIGSRTLDDRTWIVIAYGDRQPASWHLWDRKAKRATLLFTSRPELATQPLVPMHPQIIRARDGLSLVSYLSLPAAVDPDGDGTADRPAPLVLVVHGGPWARDSWGSNPLHQLLANRGYAALSVNFRGSTGFGKKFMNAGNGQWGKAMHDDLARRRRVGDRGGHHHPRAGRHPRRELRRLRDPGRPDVDPGGLRVRRRHRRPIEHHHAARVDPAVLGAGGGDVQDAGRRLDHARGQGRPRGGVAAQPRRADPSAAAHRPGRQRSAGEAGGVGSHRRRDAGREDPGELRAVPRRGPRLRPAREQPGVLGRDRGVPVGPPRRQLRATHRRRDHRVDHHGPGGQARHPRLPRGRVADLDGGARRCEGRAMPWWSLLLGALAVAGCGEAPAPADASGAWRDGVPLPEPRLEAAVVDVDGALVVIGGYDGALAISRAVWILDAGASAWRAGPPAPLAWTHANLAAVDGEVVVLGGLVGLELAASGEAWALDLEAGAWAPRAPAPPGQARGAAAVIVDGARVILAGGIADDRPIASVVAYDTGADAWSALPPLPAARSHPVGARGPAGEAIVVGGLASIDASAPRAEAWALAADGDAWQPRASMPTARGGCAAAVVAGALVCAGGEAGTSALRVVEAYDLGADAWQAWPPLPRGRAGAHAAVHDGAFTIVGGAHALRFEPLAEVTVAAP